MVTQSKSKKIFVFDRSGKYRICAHGALDEDWSDRLGGMHISNSQGDNGPIVTLTGVLHDQAELAGVLNALYEMHLSLFSVEQIGEE